MNQTKTVCTIGPASHSEEILRELIRKGMDVARLNFSHGTKEEHARIFHLIRKISGQLGKPVAVLQDLAGPKVRVGDIPPPGVHLQNGARFILTTSSVAGSEKKVSVSYNNLTKVVQTGDPILLADGTIELEVDAISGDEILCRVITGDILTAHKGLNLPTRSLDIPALTDKDKHDMQFGLDLGVDLIALSFVRNKLDIIEAKRIVETHQSPVPVIAKIEKHEAVNNIDDILEAADGIMVARGDLGVDIPLENVPIVQKDIIKKSNHKGKPVITATQMLRSMTESPRPTRAEATDVANAVLDGTDAVMLSEETAVGTYPVKSVEFMQRIIQSAESRYSHHLFLDRKPQKDVSLSVAYASCHMADQLNAEAIVARTQTGQTAGFISRYRPRQNIIALSPNPETVRRLCLYWGITPFKTPNPTGADDMIEQAAESALKTGLVKKGQIVVITSGHPVGRPGSTNMVRVKEL
jgi:pyruvate kinase